MVDVGHYSAERIGLGVSPQRARNGKTTLAVLAKADVDPATRGMMAVLSTALLDGHGGADNPAIRYWYRRQNGQDQLIHLFDVHSATDEETGETYAEEIYYRNKPLLGDLPPERRVPARELLLNAILEINLHLREGGSPKYLLKILKDCNIPSLIGEDITLPGQNGEGQFNFKVADTFNPLARGEVAITGPADLLKAIAQGEVNTLDDHRRLDGERQTFGTNRNTGTTFRGIFMRTENRNGVELSSALEPAVIPFGEQARGMKDFLKTAWRKTAGAANDNALTLKALRFLNTDIDKADTDLQIRILGSAYRIMDMFRRRRYPTPLDFIHEFDLMHMIGPTAPPKKGGRLSVVSYLGNGKQETMEGFGFDLGACKAVNYEWHDEAGALKRESVILDLGKMLAPKGSEWDGALPDILALLKDVSAIFITHRHLDHMAAIIELTRLGMLKGVKIHGSPKAMYILEQQVKAELDDKTLMPVFVPLRDEGIIHFKHLSVEYSVDAMDHSTPSTGYRVLGRTTERTENLTVDDVKGTYLFAGDGRRIQKKDFFARGLRSFGIARQDTMFDVDITNAKKLGHAPTEADAQQNLIDLMNCFPDKGMLTGLISTNDRRLKTLFKAFNRTQRNFTSVGHNIEMSLRAHNIHGVDPEYEPVHEGSNVNKFLGEDAAEFTRIRTEALVEQLEAETDQEAKAALQERIDALKLKPVEHRTRGSSAAQGWLRGALGRLAVLATGTQGNPAEMFSTIYRFAEAWSTLDADRPTAFRIRNARDWVVLIDQSAIPGNEKNQEKMIRKLVRNRGVHGVVVAIDDGFKVYGLDVQGIENFRRQYIKDGRKAYIGDDGTLTVTGVPIHPSGHGYQRDIAKTVKTANAEWNHGTHTNDPENTVAFHHDICALNGLRHGGRQFDDREHLEIEIGASPAESRITSLGRDNQSMIVFKIIREFGKFFGGTLQAKRVTKLDGRSGYAEQGLTAGSVATQYENSVVAVDFAAASQRRRDNPADHSLPGASTQNPPPEERRYKGVTMPGEVRIDDRKRDLIKATVIKLVAGA